MVLDKKELTDDDRAMLKKKEGEDDGEESKVLLCNSPDSFEKKNGVPSRRHNRSSIAQSQIQEELNRIPKNEKGEIAEVDLEKFAERIVRHKKSSKQQRKLSLYSIFGSILLTCALLGVVILAVNLAKDTRLSEDGQLVATGQSGKPVVVRANGGVHLHLDTSPINSIPVIRARRSIRRMLSGGDSIEDFDTVALVEETEVEDAYEAVVEMDNGVHVDFDYLGNNYVVKVGTDFVRRTDDGDGGYIYDDLQIDDGDESHTVSVICSSRSSQCDVVAGSETTNRFIRRLVYVDANKCVGTTWREYNPDLWEDFRENDCECNFIWCAADCTECVHEGTVAANAQEPCFSPLSTVQTRDRGTVLLKELQLGEFILTLSGSHKKVMAFQTFRLPGPISTKQAYRQIFTDTGHKVVMTARHMIFRCNDQSHPVPASTIEVGDCLLVIPQQDSKVALEASSQLEKIPTKATVVSTEEVFVDGGISPLTEDGTIIVDGIVSSCYSNPPGENSDAYVKVFGMTTFVHRHRFTHALLTPVLLFCYHVSNVPCGGGNWNAHDELATRPSSKMPIDVWATALHKMGFEYFVLFFIAGALLMPKRRNTNKKK